MHFAQRQHFFTSTDAYLSLLVDGFHTSLPLLPWNLTKNHLLLHSAFVNLVTFSQLFSSLQSWVL